MGMGVPHGTPGEGVSAAIAHSLDPTPGSFACSHSCSHRALGIEKRLEAPPGFEPGVEVLQTSALPLGDGASLDAGWKWKS